MPVQRFSSVEEMARAPVLVRPEDSFERFLRQCARYWRLVPRPHRRGVFRFRTIDEAQAARRGSAPAESARATDVRGSEEKGKGAGR
jgi:hypothetical protein